MGGDPRTTDDHPWQLSPEVRICELNSMSVVHFLLGWWVTTQRIVGNHPLPLSLSVSFVSAKFQVCKTIPDGGLPSLGWWVTILVMVGDHPWQLSPGVIFVS